MAISAVTAALALTACGNAGDDSAAVSRSNTTTPSTAAAPADRMTADASGAMNRSGSTAGTAAGTTGSSATGTTAGMGASNSGNAATSAGNAATNAATSAGNAATNAVTSAGNAAGDAALTAKVKSKLMAEPGIDSLKIDVDTEASKVTLKGEVDTAEHRAKAKEIAKNTEGVTEVVDQLQVRK